MENIKDKIKCTLLKLNETSKQELTEEQQASVNKMKNSLNNFKDKYKGKTISKEIPESYKNIFNKIKK